MLHDPCFNMRENLVLRKGSVNQEKIGNSIKVTVMIPAKTYGKQRGLALYKEYIFQKKNN